MTEAKPRLFLRHGWDVLVLGAALAVAFVIPIRYVTAPLQQPLPVVWEILVTLLFSLDLFVRRLRKRGGSLVQPPRSAWAWVVVDVLAALPLGLVLPAASLLRLTKLLRVVPLVRGWSRNVALHPTVLRLGVFVFWLVISAHWLACGWLWLGGSGSPEGSRGPYLDALYWCVTTLTTVGYGDVAPTTSAQTVYSMMVMLLGVGLYGFVIGNVATLLTKVDMAKAHYLATVERLAGFLRYHRIPVALQQHIHDYHKYLWENRMGYDESSVLMDLPPTLRRELSLVLKGDFIEKVSFLKDASRELVQDLSMMLQPTVFTPGDVIVRAGEHGRLIYFISSGSVEVISEDGKTVLQTLSDGDFFGELALLHSQPRAATIRAVGYCDMYTLDRESFAQTLARYPDFAAHIERISRERTVPRGDPGDQA